MLKELKQTAVVFERSSAVDRAGRVFTHEGKVYRGLHPTGASIAKELLNLPGCDALFDLGLVRTGVSNLQVEGFEMVVEHERVPFVSYCSEWVPAMVRDAALMVCDLSIAMAEQGYALKDGHPWNVLFDRSRPIFVDLGSIVPLDESFKWPIAEFRRHFLVPLWLFEKGWPEVAYGALREHPSGVAKTISERRWVKKIPYRYHRMSRRYAEGRKHAPKDALLRFLHDLRDLLGTYRMSTASGKWSEYDQKPGVLGEPAGFSAKAKSVNQVLASGGARTVLDMASNKGWFAYLAADLGHRVVAFDYEPSAVTDIYTENREGGRDVLPVRMDFLWPTPPFGLGLCGPSAFERFRCDTTMALALVHHLVFGQQVRFETIARILDGYTEKTAMVEFIPHDDVYVSKWMTDEHGWYTLDGFVEAMRPYFQSVEVLPSNPEPRSILVFSR